MTTTSEPEAGAQINYPRALYIELRKYVETKNHYETAQFVFTPEAKTGSGKFVPFQVFTRITSKAKPRTGWRPSFSEVNEGIAGTLIGPSAEDSLQYSAKVVEFLAPYMAIVATSDTWTLFKHPLAAEIGPAELDELAGGKEVTTLPDGLYSRIKRCREAAGFGESLWEADPA